MLELLQRNISKDASLESEMSREPATLEIDSSQLRQVIMNLVLNAADSLESRPGRIAVRTRIEHGPTGPAAWVLEVIDSGSGMSEDVRKRIFDPFFTTKKTGRGLGLSTVHGIVQRCKGEIEVRSEPGQGTTFFVRFPLAQGAPAEVPPPSPKPTKPRAIRILVADDEAMVRRSMRRMLETNHANVVEVADGAAAIEALNHSPEPFDLLLLDVVMPRKSGYEVLTEVRERYPSLKVILMSGYNNLAAIPGTEPTHYTPDAALQKPFAWTDLEHAMQTVLRSGQPSSA
jgi:two-component system cell cycle sensor histidine kinase/response regulator CckA